VQDSHAKTVLQSPNEAFEAAKQFGLFTRLLCGFDTNVLKTTLPKFHDLVFRDQQFQTAIIEGNQDRRNQCKDLMDKIISYSFITERYQLILADPAFKLRVTHHDTKISNVLFNKADKAICVIDLDTLMPGYFISDLGDMMRTYLCPVSEEEKDFDKIIIRPEFYEAIITGYCNEMGDELTESEKQAIHYSGEFMIYMQALRFMTDYLNNDQYYGASYPEQNLVRAGNQMVLLEKLSSAINRPVFSK
jgi:Ser/Thr protein kinase RdoA (MazF antagonist)